MNRINQSKIRVKILGIPLRADVINVAKLFVIENVFRFEEQLAKRDIQHQLFASMLTPIVCISVTGEFLSNQKSSAQYTCG
ncbi:MAG: hypothetical protein Q7R66_10480 [Undibacterium sp.]|nr:hypothetical protein [Undibacterium sp.]